MQVHEMPSSRVLVGSLAKRHVFCTGGSDPAVRPYDSRVLGAFGYRKLRPVENAAIIFAACQEGFRSLVAKRQKPFHFTILEAASAWLALLATQGPWRPAARAAASIAQKHTRTLRSVPHGSKGERWTTWQSPQDPILCICEACRRISAVQLC